LESERKNKFQEIPGIWWHPWAKAHAQQLAHQRLFSLYHHEQYLTNDEINDETNMPQQGEQFI
jgi:hypothetical protein